MNQRLRRQAVENGVAYRRRRCAVLMRSPVYLACAGLLLSAVFPLSVRARDNTVARTEAGDVQGVREAGVLIFRGVPYAAPPVGTLRFSAPVAAQHWQGVRDARDFMPACPQVVDRDPTENNNSVMAEDCLGLNVWTPGTDGGRRPVMVFIHGGAFIEGSARNSWCDGGMLARRGNVVVVTLQYRIGALGFLELSQIGGEKFASSGNLGILDQLAVLQWIKKNIAAFGGDPGNVTLFGESAGATSVAILMTMPGARGLFHKVILESNSGTRIGHDLVHATAMAREFMKVAGVESVEQLRSLDWRAVRDAERRFFESAFGDSTFGPTWDGVVIAEPPMKTILSGGAARVPVLLGTNLDEVRYWTEIEELPLQTKPESKLREQVGAFAGPASQGIVDTYLHLNDNYGDAVVQLLTDALWRMAAIRTAEALNEHQPVYMYLFTYRSTAPHARYGAAHAMELPFVFGGIDALDVIAFTGRAPHREALRDQVQNAWLQFARTGMPGTPGAPWPKYELSTRTTMELGPATHVVNDPYAEQRKAWNGVPFDNVKPSGDQATALLSEN
jgi:para-nitrobenzyl esterase